MKLVWTERSRAHLTALHDHIAAEDPAAATGVATRIVDLVGTLLREHPQSGRPGRVAGTRELVITGTPYLVAYETNDETITILAVLHSARRWPNRF